MTRSSRSFGDYSTVPTSQSDHVVFWLLAVVAMDQGGHERFKKLAGDFRFVASLDIEVTVPPLIGPDLPKEEVLFTVNHDPEQEPEPLTLPCRADGLPAPSYSWLKDGSPYDWHDDGDDDGDDDNGAGERVEMLQGEGTLVFHDPQPEDEGVYQCIAENSVGVAHSDLITVRRAVMGSFPKAEHRIVTAAEWQPLKLPCTPPEGYPEPTLHWVLQNSDGGLRSLDSERITVDEEGTLWFSYVTREDASGDALYACAASSATSGQKMYLVKDEDGFLEVLEDPPEDDSVTVISLPTEYRMGNWVYLNVSYPEDEESTHPEASIAPVKQYLSPRQITVLEGEDVKLHCLYGGYPVPDIRWWRESRADVEDDQLEHFGKILVLEDVDHEDTGSYYCQASNEAGESEAHQFTVYVEAAPEFIVEPEVVNLPEGETATLSCEAKGDPEPIITWTKNGQPMDTHETTLMFDRLSFADKTVIACNASNEHGYVYKSVYLNVLSLPPEWMTEPKDVYVLEGGSAELECEAFGSPDPEITWARRDGDEKTVIHDEDPRYDVNDHQLLINTVDDTTDGTYVCTATNKFASIESEAKVAMRSMTRAEVSIKDERVEAGDHVTLDCRVAIDPLLKSSVTWLKDNHKIENWVLEIEEVHGHDSGVYTCRVHTDLDDVTDDLILTVEGQAACAFVLYGHLRPEPPSLTNVECNPRSAYLGWASTGDNNAKLQGFVIQYRTRLHPEWKDAKNQIPAAETSFTVNMSPGLNYTYRVLAFNRVGMSEPSEDTAECSAPGLPPDFHPENVTVSGPAPGVLHVSWEEMEPEDHNGPDFQYKSELELENLPPYQEYEVKVEARNSYGEALEEADVITGFSGQDEPEVAPAKVRVADADATDVVLTWKPVDEDSLNGPLLGYKVEYWEESDDSDPEEILTTGPVARAELTGLRPFTNYHARISVANTEYTGPSSDTVEFTTAEGDAGAVSDLEVRAMGADSLVVKWDAPDDPQGVILGYEVRYQKVDEDGEEEWEHYEGHIPASTRMVKLADLEEEVSYEVSVAAVNGAGEADEDEENVLLEDKNADGVIDEDDVGDINNDGIIDEEDLDEADIDNDGDVDEDDLKIADKDGDGDVDAADVLDLDGDGRVDGDDLEVTDRDGDGDIDARDYKLKSIFLSDVDGDGDVDSDDVIDVDDDGDIDEDDKAIADIDNDGDVDEDDVKAADRDGDGDVDIADIGDEDDDGDIDGQDVILADKDGDGDIDASDDDEEDSLLEDRNGDGTIDRDDVGDLDGDGDVDLEDFQAADIDDDGDAADIDDDGDVDEDDLKHSDRDGDNDVDASDVQDLDGDGFIDEDDLDVKDKDGDGDIDRDDFRLRKVILADTDNDGDIDEDDVLDTDNDGDVDQEDIDADKDGDGDIDNEDDDGEHVLLSDIDGDGDIDVTDIDNDGDVDEDDRKAADVDNDGDVDKDDVAAADRDGDGDVDAADILDVDGDGDVDAKDLMAADKDGDGDIDQADVENMDVFLKDTDGDGDVDEDDVLDTDHDGDVDEEDIAVADIDNDGDVDMDDVIAADQDGDGDVDFKDIGDEDGDGNIDGDDLEAADRDGDGDVDAADDGRGVDVVINWKPDFDKHPGVDFYVESRIQGTSEWQSSPVERRHLYQTLSGLDPRRNYEVRVVARDGDYETPSGITVIQASEDMGQEEPTVGAVVEDNPILWTWFVIAVMASVTMICVVFFSMWVYSHRMARVAELRASLYEGYEPAQPEPTKKDADVEAAKPEEVVEDEMTANFQRKQLAAMMKRQETVQSVDSFASHDDDFAEYGDESMVGQTETLVAISHPRAVRIPNGLACVLADPRGLRVSGKAGSLEEDLGSLRGVRFISIALPVSKVPDNFPFSFRVNLESCQRLLPWPLSLGPSPASPSFSNRASFSPAGRFTDDGSLIHQRVVAAPLSRHHNPVIISHLSLITIAFVSSRVQTHSGR
ncbi:putative Neuroglian precursor [Penaeus vannamei]|uniref:Putative Neuroglian n=1 Tax=Penaeus vannamei TaxID=6689 RepID=A0A423SSF4_PENVA|nr:putative Neuroglian precursor [Penaeus vannamei]